MRARDVGLLLLVVGTAAAGCGLRDQEANSSSDSPVQVESSWNEQIAAVRSGATRQIRVTSASVSAAALGDLANECDALEVLDLETLDADGDQLSVLARLPNLKRIRLGGPVDDADVAQLARAEHLIAVNLPESVMSDAGLKLLAALPHLELLRFHSPHVTDEGMAHIANMPALRFLHVIDVPLTDAGLAPLHGMSRLESFYLDGGRCSEAGLRKLLAARPDLHFHRDQLHLPGDPLDDHAE